jgi:hypothetical protein
MVRWSRDGDRWVTTGALFALLAVLPPCRLAAQVPEPTIDTAGPTADSIRNDSLRRDATARYLAAEAMQGEHLATVPNLGDEGPRAAGSRIVLDRRNVAWRTAETVADLLMEVPGMYVWRGGWFGRPAYGNYRGRGATSIEWVVDGVPFLPLGADSVGVDPNLFSLMLFERVEIERWPGGVRVLLYTPQHDRRATRSRVGIATGDFDIARYQGDFEYRWRNGLGFTAAAEYFNAPSSGGGLADTASVTSALVRLQYVPREDRGFQLQYLAQRPDRDPFVTSGDTLGAGLVGTRSDVQFRAFMREGSETEHLQADVIYNISQWTAADGDQRFWTGGVVLGLRRPRWRLGATTLVRDKWTPLAFRGEAGIAPTRWVSFNAEASHEEHDGERSSDWLGVRGAVSLPLGFEVDAGTRQGQRVVAPRILADQAQDLNEFDLRGRWRSRILTLEGGISQTAAFSPYSFQPYLQIDSLRPLGKTKWVDLGATLTPLTWLKVDGWYSTPQDGVEVDGIPPTHSTVRGEIRSRFLRQFPSGIFELRLAGEMETWGTGVIGTDGGGVPIPLKGATFYRMYFGMKLGGFQFFWDRVNTQGTELTYVPGFRVPKLGQTFGMRWEFSN